MNKHKINHEGVCTEGVCIPRYRILSIFTQFTFDFLALYEMYFEITSQIIDLEN